MQKVLKGEEENAYGSRIVPRLLQSRLCGPVCRVFKRLRRAFARVVVGVDHRRQETFENVRAQTSGCVSAIAAETRLVQHGFRYVDSEHDDERAGHDARSHPVP